MAMLHNTHAKHEDCCGHQDISRAQHRVMFQIRTQRITRVELEFRQGFSKKWEGFRRTAGDRVQRTKFQSLVYRVLLFDDLQRTVTRAYIPRFPAIPTDYSPWLTTDILANSITAQLLHRFARLARISLHASCCRTSYSASSPCA